MTVGELINELAKYPTEAEVLATWESTFKDVSVYRASNGAVIIDADDGSYRSEIESGEIEATT